MGIDPEKSIPKYLQLKDSIKRHLQHGGYESDQKIPTESDLMAQFNVSRSTVRQALGELVNEGVIYRKQGSGSFFSGTIQHERKPSYLIGMMIPEISSYIYPQIIRGVHEVAQQHRYHIVLESPKTNPGKELACIEQLLEKEIDGLLLEPASGFQYTRSSDISRFLKALPIPVVFMDWAIDDPAISYVALNDVEGGFIATRYLLEAGHKRIACIRPTDHLPGIHRYHGYRKALEASGIAYDSRFDKPSATLTRNVPDEAYMLMKELLDLGDDRPTAVFCFNDQTALQGYDAIREAGLRVPEDMSLMGFDDSELAVRMEVPLTTVIHPKYYIGKWAVEILFDKIKQQDQSFPRHLLITPKIAVRDSIKRLS